MLWKQVCRPALFKRSMRKFNVAWWAYPFPLTVLAVASTKYAQEVRGARANGLMLLLSLLSVLVFLALLIITALTSHKLASSPIGSNTQS
jgi:tellurite resistance protein TehA-like permease